MLQLCSITGGTLVHIVKVWQRLDINGVLSIKLITIYQLLVCITPILLASFSCKRDDMIT